jgi:hypothetical protein
VAAGSHVPSDSEGHGHPSARQIFLRPGRPAQTASVPTIKFDELMRSTARAPELTEKLLSLSGQRVTLVGFMVEMELPAKGGFYLASYPATCDESAAGRGDLPQNSVFVVVPAARGNVVAFIPGPLEVHGTLDVGNREDEHGEVNTIRLSLARSVDLKYAKIPRPVRSSKPVKEEGKR